MKKKILLFAMITMGCTRLFAQTNTFPATGNVGIGTLTPAEKLTVVSASNVVGFAHTNGTVKLGSVLTTTGAFFGTATNHPLNFRTNNNGSQIILLTNGNVGIGTTTPLGKLDVRGDSYLNGVRAGIGGGADVENTAFGSGALDNNAATGFIDGELVFGGSSNTAIGKLALQGNTYGTANTAVGNRAATSNTTGIYNTAVGTYASYGGNGSRNTAVGAYTLAFSTGFSNTAIGSQALTSNTSGYSNTGLGQASLFTNTTGIDNTAVGDNSQFYNTSGSRNTSVGESSLFINSTGANNTAVGENSMYANTN
jgi:trimeric autotransporter adhesin